MHQCIGILIVTGVSQKLIIIIEIKNAIYAHQCVPTNLRPVAAQTPCKIIVLLFCCNTELRRGFFFSVIFATLFKRLKMKNMLSS